MPPPGKVLIAKLKLGPSLLLPQRCARSATPQAPERPLQQHPLAVCCSQCSSANLQTAVRTAVRRTGQLSGDSVRGQGSGLPPRAKFLQRKYVSTPEVDVADAMLVQPSNKADAAAASGRQSLTRERGAGDWREQRAALGLPCGE
eukprot:3937430-Rhodomonas_salina.3